MPAIGRQHGPVHAAIEAALIEKLDRTQARVLELGALASEGRLTQEYANELLRVVEEVRADADELGSWTGSPFHALLKERQDHSINEAGKVVLSESGFAPSEFVEVVELAKRKPRGRPAELRPIALAALETRLQHPRRKWKDIVADLCPCGKTPHDECCVKNITREVTRLRECLRRHNILPGSNGHRP